MHGGDGGGGGHGGGGHGGGFGGHHGGHGAGHHNHHGGTEYDIPGRRRGRRHGWPRWVRYAICIAWLAFLFGELLHWIIPALQH
jgi:hypothetical protein